MPCSSGLNDATSPAASLLRCTANTKAVTTLTPRRWPSPAECGNGLRENTRPTGSGRHPAHPLPIRLPVGLDVQPQLGLRCELLKPVNQRFGIQVAYRPNPYGSGHELPS